MPEVRRNDRCPCESGKRYKDCHGRLTLESAPDNLQEPLASNAGIVLRDAAACLGSGKLADARALCLDVLKTTPGHPEALRILGRCDFEEGDPAAGLAKVLQAARSMQTFSVTSAVQYAIWSDVGFLFTQALAGQDTLIATQKRAEYLRFQDAATCSDEAVLVSVIFLAGGRDDWMLDALKSVAAQSYPNIEVVVVESVGAVEISKPVLDLIFACNIRHRRVKSPSASAASRINAGVRASSGAFVNVLDGRDLFGHDRIKRFVDGVARRGKSWGFSDAAFVDAAGGTIRPEENAVVGSATERLGAIAESDTVGFSFIHQSFVAVDVGNLFFSRKLYDDIQGFRESHDAFGWDFALRAVWLAEPVFVGYKDFTRRIVPAPSSADERARSEVQQVAMFREFYARARAAELPPNPYAPSSRHWGLHFLKSPFQVGHVLAFPLETLEDIAKTVLANHDSIRTRVPQPGVNLVGFAYGEFGLGENLRAIARSCELEGIPFAVRDVDMRLKTRQADRTLAAHIVHDLPYVCSLFCLNPDMMKPVAPLMKPVAGTRRYNIGFWFWELEQVPDEWTDAIGKIDEIWVATEFIAEAMRRVTAKPVFKVPTPIAVNLEREYSRAEFELPEDKFLFLFSFDFNSFAMRKNPDGAIAAFKHAFDPARTDVGLVIKSINGANNPAKYRQLMELVGGDPRIFVTDGFLSRSQVSGLHSVVDAYVSLHRAEGLGLGLAESMYLGKPVIGTAYSGNLEFMNPDNSCLVPYKLVPISKGQYLYDDERFRWADPDVEEAGRCMARLADDVEFRTRIARRGQRDILTRFSHENAAKLIRARLESLKLL